MNRRTLTSRVEILERNAVGEAASSARLDGVEGRTTVLEEQFLHVEATMKAESSVVRTEMSAQFARVDERFAQIDERFARIDIRFEQVDARFERVEQSIRDLREEMRNGDHETRVLMRVLHEDVIARIALLGERFPPANH